MKGGPGVEIRSIVAVAEFAHQNLVWRGGIVQHIEVIQLVACDRHIEDAGVALAGQHVVDYARFKTGDQITQDGAPAFGNEAAHLGAFLRGWIVLELSQKLVAGSVGEDEGRRFEMLLKIGRVGEGGE